MMKILFVGPTWKGSSARSLREGLDSIPGVSVDEVGEDHYAPKGQSLVIRGSNRLLRWWHQAELEREIERKLAAIRPDVLIVYKGNLVTANTVRAAQQAGVLTVNVFPDYSPHSYGSQLRAAMGEYDLVISTKPFHPAGWNSIYGYQNRCVFVPHGYDPAVHYWQPPPTVQDVDIIMAASWRPQYQRLVVDLANELDTNSLRVAIAGNGWHSCRRELPSHWELPGGLYGRAYGELVRRAKIVIAPLHREVVVGRVRQPGDVDTTRTYELAATGSFFLHRRTDYLKTVYDELEEVPMWDDAAELAALVRHYLPLENERRAMAARAHARAVPAYSTTSRAQQVLAQIQALINGQA